MDDPPGRFPPLPPSGPPQFPPQPYPAPPYGAPPAGPFPLDVGRVMHLTLSLFRYRWKTFVGAALIVMLPISALLAVSDYISGTAISRWFADLQAAAQGVSVDLISTFPLQFILISWLVSVVAGIAGYVASAAIVHAAEVTFSGGQARALDSVRAALSRLSSLAGVFVFVFLAVLAIVLAAAAIGVMLILVTAGGGRIAPGPGVFLALIVFVGAFVVLVFLSTRWAFAVQSVVLDGLGVADSLRRSWRLVSGSTWRVLGYSLLFGLLIGLIAVLPATAVTLVLVPEVFSVQPTIVVDPLRSAALSFFNSLISVLIMPLPMIGLTLLYFDLRWRRGEPVPVPGGGTTAAGGGPGGIG